MLPSTLSNIQPYSAKSVYWKISLFSGEYKKESAKKIKKIENKTGKDVKILQIGPCFVQFITIFFTKMLYMIFSKFSV